MAEFTTNTTAIDSKVFTGKLDSSYITARQAANSSLEFKKTLWPDIVNNYGKGYYGFMDLISNKTPFNFEGSSITVVEENKLDYTVKVGTNAGAGIAVAGANVATTFKLDKTSDYDSSNNSRLRVGDTIYIPRAYTGTGEVAMYQVKSIAGATNELIFTAVPLNELDSIATEVPIGTKIVVGAWKTGTGGGQPGIGYLPYLSNRTFYTQITGESFFIEGGVKSVALETMLKKNGAAQKDFLTEGLFNMEFMFDKRQDRDLYSSQTTTASSAATMAKETGTSQTKSRDGYRQILGKRGQIWNYDSSQNFDLFKLNQIDEIFDTQDVTEKNIIVGCGPDLFKRVEDGSLDFVKEYSKSDFMTNMESIGVQFKVITKGTRTYTFVCLDTFRDQTGLGRVELGYREEGFMTPASTVSVRMNGATTATPFDKLQIGYRNNNSENRTRMMGPITGVNGYGLPFQHQWDTSTWHIKSESGLIALCVNQDILMKPTVYKTA